MLVPQYRHSHFFGYLRRIECILWNISSKKQYLVPSVWEVIFVVACWWIWKWLNEQVFNSNSLPVHAKIRDLNIIVEESIGARKELDGLWQGKLTRHEVLISWKIHTIKVNTHKVAKGNPRVTGTGCVIRYRNGNWLGWSGSKLRDSHVGDCTTLGGPPKTSSCLGEKV